MQATGRAELPAVRAVDARGHHRSSARVAVPAEAEELEVVADQPEAARAAHALADGGEHLVVEEAAFEILHATTVLADQVVVVSGELLGQLEPLGTLGRIGDPHEPQLAQ